MDILDALAVIAAYENQGKLSGAQRRLLLTSRKAVWDHAEMIRSRAEE